MTKARRSAGLSFSLPSAISDPGSRAHLLQCDNMHRKLIDASQILAHAVLPQDG